MDIMFFKVISKKYQSLEIGMERVQYSLIVETKFADYVEGNSLKRTVIPVALDIIMP